MPRVCTVCSHPARPDIDQALVRGQPYRTIAQQHGVSPDAVLRHSRAHVPDQLARAHEAAQAVEALSLLEQVQQLRERAFDILEAAEAAGDLRTALLAIREARGCLDLLAEIEGRISRQPVTNVLVASPEWHQIRSCILAALDAYPEARRSVVLALTSDVSNAGGMGGTD